MDYVRYAIWWVPRPGGALARFGARWSGWCADRGLRAANPLVAARPRRGVPGSVARTGLHAGLAAPFRLARGRSAWALEDALATLAEQTAAIRLPVFALAVDDGRVALVPSGADARLSELIAEVTAVVRSYREAPPHRADGRFVMPLTDRLGAATACAVAAEIAPILVPVLERPQGLADLSLVGDPGDGRPWRLIGRHQLTGETDGTAMPLSAAMRCRGPLLMAPLRRPLPDPDAHPA